MRAAMCLSRRSLSSREFFAAEEFSWSSLQGIGWFPRRGIFDVWTLFIGTLWITGIAHIREAIGFPRMLYRIYP